MKGEIKVERGGGNLLISIPESTIVYAAEHNPENPLVIKDKEALLNYYKEYLNELDVTEDGLTSFERFLDSIAVEATESGLEGIEIKELV
jgi:hypothetical protein